MPKIHRARNPTPYGKQSRKKQKLAYIHIRNRCREQARFFGGLFTTYDHIDGSSWADIYFPSRKHPRMFYNATIDCARYAYFEECKQLAWKRSEEKMAIGEHEDLFSRLEKQPDGSSLWLGPSEKQTAKERAAFGGMTHHEWLDDQSQKIADAKEVAVHENVEFDRSYGYGIGLTAIVNAPELSAPLLDAFVERFLDSGELPYRSAAPLTFDAPQKGQHKSANAISSNPAECSTDADIAYFEEKIRSRALAKQLKSEIQAAEPPRRESL